MDPASVKQIISSGRSARELESQLSGLYKILNKRKQDVASKMQQYSVSKVQDNSHFALYLHIGLNIITVSALFLLLY